MKIKRNDKVKIISGKDKGRQGTVEKVYKNRRLLLIPGVNLYKRHIKKSERTPQGGVIEIPRPISVAKVMFICPQCGKTSRVGYEVVKNKRYRICKKCRSRV